MSDNTVSLITEQETENLLHWFSRSRRWWHELSDSDRARVVASYRKGDTSLPYSSLSTHTSTPESK